VGALAADDALKQQDQETRFRIRETPDWREHAAALESEMLKRGMIFEVIDWSEDQVPFRFEEGGTDDRRVFRLLRRAR
jgi:hypothetical protein